MPNDIQVIPHYFSRGAEPMLIADYGQLNNFLNHTNYPCTVHTSKNKGYSK